MARVKSESPPPTHWKKGQKPWKPKPENDKDKRYSFLYSVVAVHGQSRY